MEQVPAASRAAVAGSPASCSSREAQRGDHGTPSRLHLILDSDPRMWYKLWLSARHIELALLGLFALLHAALLPYNIVQVVPELALSSVFIAVDCTQFVLIAALMHFSIKHGRHLGHEADREPPLFFRRWHAWLLGLSTFLAAVRLALVEAVLCNDPTLAVGLDYRPCRSYTNGTFPFPAMGLCIAVLVAYTALLATKWFPAIVVVLAASLGTYTMWVATNFVVSGPNPQPFDLAMSTVLIAFVTSMELYGVYRRLSEWALSQHQLRAVRRAYLAQHQASRMKAKLRERVRLAREQGYERAVAYAAHELRNPLHAISAVLDLDLPTLEHLSSQVPAASRQQLNHIISDMRLAQTRTTAIHRVIRDITDFSRLRDGDVAVVHEVTSLTRILRHTSMACTSIASATAWRGAVVDPGLPDTLVTDAMRLEQLLADCVSHAISHGAAALEAAIVLMSDTAGYDHEPHRAISFGTSSQRSEPTMHAEVVRGHTDASISADMQAGSCIVTLAPAAGYQLAVNRHGDSSATEANAELTSHIGCQHGCSAIAVQPGRGSYIVLALRACGLSLAASESMVIDPAHIDALHWDSVTPLFTGTSSSPASDTEEYGNTPESGAGSLAPIRTAVHASGLATTVAKLLALRFGGDLIIVTRPALAGDNDTWYIAALPFAWCTMNGGEIMQLGASNQCARCGAPLDSQARLHAAALFRPSGRLSPRSEQLVLSAIVDKASALLSREPRRQETRVLANETAPVENSVVPLPSACLSDVSQSMPAGMPIYLLYADDDAANRRLLVRMVAAIGGTVVAVDDGDRVAPALARAGMLTRGAIDRLAAQGLPFDMGETVNAASAAAAAAHACRQFDCILLDIVMTRTDGAEVCKALRQVLPPGFPIIAATGNANDPARLDAAGFTAVLEKPFSLRRLREVLQAAVERTAPV